MVAALTAADALVYRFIQHRGHVTMTGDEPHYLVVARAVSEGHVHPLAAYVSDLRTHAIFDWPPGPPTNLGLQLYTGPRGPVSTHPLGLSVLLAPFVAIGGATSGRIGLMAIEAAAVVYFLHRVARLTGLDGARRAVLALLVAAPAIWVAATQVYPDFLTGTLLACALADTLVLEIGRAQGWLAPLVTAGCLAVLPWLHQQNLPAAVVVLAALLRLGWRRRSTLFVSIAAIGSWLLLLVFNLVEYGHALGLPQPFPTLNGAGVTEILGLLFDRHQGMFLQVPTVAVGVAGLWLTRRRAPVSAIATVLAAGSLLYLNGTFIHAPYGGTSFAGRFEWSSLVPLLIWCPFVLSALSRLGVAILGGVTGLLWLLQAVPILAGTHQYFNQQLQPGDPWDPVSYPGWWGPLDRIFPVLAPGEAQFGSPWFGLLVAAGLTVAGVIVIVCVQRRARYNKEVTAASLALSAVAVVLAMAAPLPLPAGPLTYTGTDVGSPLNGGPNGAAAQVPLTGIAAGSYQVSIDYSLSGTPSATMDSICTGRAQPVQATLPADQHRAELQARCPAGTLYLRLSVPAGSLLDVGHVYLSKVATG